MFTPFRAAAHRLTLAAALAAVAFCGTAQAQSATATPYWTPSTLWKGILGTYQTHAENGMLTDVRIDNPDYTIKACRIYGGDRKKYDNSPQMYACGLFLYPSSRNLPQAAEARTLYEGDYAGLTTPQARIRRALMMRHDAELEIQQAATPEVLNSFVDYFDQPTQITIAEFYVAINHPGAATVQWLYDHGARLCDKDAPDGAARFSCIDFYFNADHISPKAYGVPALDVMEKNGYRPHTQADLKAAFDAQVRGDDLPSIKRFIALAGPADPAKIDAVKMAEANARAADQRRIAAEQEANRRKTDERTFAILAPLTTSQPLAPAVANLEQRGLLVCRLVEADAGFFIFRARVEDVSAHRLQLRASSIRGLHNTEMTNYLYNDVRIDPGLVFWDDAANWRSDC